MKRFLSGSVYRWQLFWRMRGNRPGLENFKSPSEIKTGQNPEARSSAEETPASSVARKPSAMFTSHPPASSKKKRIKSIHLTPPTLAQLSIAASAQLAMFMSI